MNRYDFTQPGGFPFDQGVLAFIQDCITTASKSASLAGPLAILSGCEVVGSNVNAGYVVINGEILPFSAGLIEDTVIIVQTGTAIAYQDAVTRTTKFERVARFGSAGGVGEHAWANFKRNTTEGVLARIERCEGLLRPFLVEGGMTWWKGTIADIPAGFREVVAMRGQLPLAYDPDDVTIDTIGLPVGNRKVSISSANVPTPAGLVTGKDGPRGKPADGGGAAINYITSLSNAAAAATQLDITPKAITGCWIEPIPGYFN